MRASTNGNKRLLQKWSNISKIKRDHIVNAIANAINDGCSSFSPKEDFVAVLSCRERDGSCWILSIRVYDKYYVRFECIPANKGDVFVLLDFEKTSFFKKQEIEQRFTA
tara:strand:+ start:2044 stop:2370 length:327 start_codon:yes stop_codon:yes gene_type:complete